MSSSATEGIPASSPGIRVPVVRIVFSGLEMSAFAAQFLVLTAVEGLSR